VAAVFGLGQGAEAGAPLALPGPSPRLRAEGLSHTAKLNEGCEGCHSAIAKEWRSSLHQQAWHDPVFQKALAIEPEPFCRGCHAPEADAAGEPPKAAQDIGVGCVTCHVQGEKIVGSRSLAGSKEGHPVVGDARLGTTDACASCHQFDFPRVKGLPMQSTLEEHASSSFANTSCQSCHMTAVDGASADSDKSPGQKHRSHDFSVIADKSMIQKAATATAARSGGQKIVVTISPLGAGHAFPTGDMFRRLEVRAEAVDAKGAVVARATPVWLARTFADQTQAYGSTRRVEVADTRVPPPGGGSRLVELDFGTDVSAHSLRWVLAYQRMDHAMAASFGVEQARDEVEVVTVAIEPVKKKEGR
jgi:hypothetical protein